MNVFNTIGNFLDDHKSELSFGTGLAFTGAATVLAVKATPKAMASIEEEKRRKGRELTFFEKAKVSWKHYIVPAVAEALGVVCLVYGKKMDLKQTANALSFAGTSQKLLKTYSEKMIEQIGEKKEEEIRKAVIDERIKEDKIAISGSEDCCLMDGDAWYYDPLFGKKFISSDIKIKSAVNVVNHLMLTNDNASYNDFYDEIRTLTPVSVNQDLLCDFGDAYGFNIADGLLDIEYEPLDLGIKVNGVKTPAFAIRFVSKESGKTRFPELII